MKWIPISLLLSTVIMACSDWPEVEPLGGQLFFEVPPEEVLRFVDTTMNYQTFEVCASWEMDSSFFNTTQLNAIDVELKTNKTSYMELSNVCERYSNINRTVPIIYQIRLVNGNNRSEVLDEIVFLFD